MSEFGAHARPTLPLPLPGDVDLSDLPHMPLFDARLTKSRAWLTAKNWRGGGPGLGFALMNLWMGAFRTVPAGSLEDDDDMLADAAKVSIENWEVLKDKALRGWERHQGRVWHPVICEIAWDLWLKRLSARHENAINSWRMVCKRASDKGQEPPAPPGSLVDWMSVKFPASHAYRAAMAEAAAVASAANNVENSSHNAPKRSEGKVDTPLTPQPSVAQGPESGLEGTNKAERKRWYAKELGRLQSEFGDMLPLMLSNLQKRGVSGEFGLVQNFKNCWVDRGAGGEPVIVTPSARRAELIRKEQGEWLNFHWPRLAVRHATVAEKRERPAT